MIQPTTTNQASLVVMEQEERELISLLKNGQDDAAYELFRQLYVPILIRLIVGKFRDPNIPEIANQFVDDAFMALAKSVKKPNWHLKKSLDGLIQTITSNSVKKFLIKERKQKLRLDIMEEFSPYDLSTPADVSFENSELVNKILPLLTENERKLLVAKFIDELSNKEIAEAFNTTESTIKVNFNRCMKKVRAIALQLLTIPPQP